MRDPEEKVRLLAVSRVCDAALQLPERITDLVMREIGGRVLDKKVIFAFQMCLVDKNTNYSLFWQPRVRQTAMQGLARVYSQGFSKYNSSLFVVFIASCDVFRFTNGVCRWGDEWSDDNLKRYGWIPNCLMKAYLNVDVTVKYVALQCKRFILLASTL